MNRVLLIEPNVLIREFFESCLNENGIDVFCASNQKEVLQILNENEINLLIMEPFLNPSFLNEPEPDIKDLFWGKGYYLLDLIRKNIENSSKLKVFLVTSFDENTINQAGFVFDKYFSKPVRFEEVLQNIRNYKNCCQACSIA
ncbi:MAG: response regulator transcription factor [Patescibacteria group bacterium]|nr:response regulator transcription factor [Patescibacteria group bacterium]